MAKGTGSAGMGPGALVITLLAAVGLSSPLLRTASAPQSRLAHTVPSASRYTGDTTIYGHSASALLQNYLDTNEEQFPSNKVWLQSKPQATWLGDDTRKNLTARFLIATVPQPQSAPLRYQFDSFVDAIGKAFNSAGYSLDSFDLPWPSSSKEDDSGEFRLGQDLYEEWESDGQEQPHTGASSALSAPASKPPVLTLKQKDDRRTQDDPGLILFRIRERGREPDLWVVYLVAETPTRGVNKAQLRDALEEISWLSGWKTDPAPPVPEHLRRLVKPEADGIKTLRILGPSYSGTADSLRNTLDQWIASESGPASVAGSPPTAPIAPASQLQVRIVSGSATSVASQLDRTEGGVHLEFKTMRVEDNLIEQYESELPGAAGNRIAILTDTTPYGFLSAGSGTLHLTFPLHISALRAAMPSEQKPNLGPELRRKDIPLSDGKGQEREDIIRSYSARTASYDELVLSDLLETIRREKIRFVGIVATDVEDLVFLAAQIRTNCPNTILFTTASDLRFVHSEVNADLLGMRVFSTYPLFTPNQRWSYGFRGATQTLQFAGEDSEGVYNATLAQLDRDDLLLEYGKPWPEAARRERTAPVLWLSIVGHGHIWPIKFFDVGSSPKNGHMYLARASHRAEPGEMSESAYPDGFKLALLLSSLSLMLIALVALRPSLPAGMSHIFGGGVLQWLTLPPKGRYSHEYALRMIAFLGAVVIGYAIALAFLVYALLHLSHWTGDEFLMLSAAVTFIAGPPVVCSLIASVVRILKTGMPTLRTRGTSDAALALVGSVIAFVLAMLFVNSQFSPGGPSTYFAFLRAVNLGDGVSVLRPLIFLEVAALCSVAADLWRIWNLAEHPVQDPFLGFETARTHLHESFRGLSQDEGRIRHWIDCAPHELGGFWVVVAAGVGLMWILFPSWWSPDDGWFPPLFFVTGVFVYFLFSLSFLRFALIWSGTCRLLRRLYWHPTRSAYEALRKASLEEREEAQKIALFEPLPSFSAMEFCLQCARTIFAHTGTVSIRTAIERVERNLSDFFKRDRADPDRARIARLLAQRHMAALSAEIVDLAEPCWRSTAAAAGAAPPNSCGCATFSAPAGSTCDDKVEEQARLFLASRVVDFLRHVFLHLSGLFGFGIAGILAMLLALSSYPFLQSATLLWMSWVVLLAAIGLGLVVFVQINRNRILSMLSGTEPGHFNFTAEFAGELILYAVVPILTLLGAQFPQAFSSIFAWIGGIFGPRG